MNFHRVIVQALGLVFVALVAGYLIGTYGGTLRSSDFAREVRERSDDTTVSAVWPYSPSWTVVDLVDSTLSLPYDPSGLNGVWLPAFYTDRATAVMFRVDIQENTKVNCRMGWRLDPADEFAFRAGEPVYEFQYGGTVTSSVMYLGPGIASVSQWGLGGDIAGTEASLYCYGGISGGGVISDLKVLIKR